MILDDRYVAGLFDGEGYVSIAKWEVPGREYIRYNVLCGIGMSYYPLMAAMRFQFGGLLNRNDSANRKSAKNRVCYNWRLGSVKATNFLKRIAPLLIVKREEAELAIEFQEHVTKHMSDFKYRSHMRPELYAYREARFLRMKELKKQAFDIPDCTDPMLALYRTNVKVEFSA